MTTPSEQLAAPEDIRRAAEFFASKILPAWIQRHCHSSGLLWLGRADQMAIIRDVLRALECGHADGCPESCVWSIWFRAARAEAE